MLNTANRNRRALTLTEVLIAFAVLSVLATLLMPMLLRNGHGYSKLANCISNLRQIGQGYTQYTAAWESWLISAGNDPTVLDRDEPILEDAWIKPWRYRVNSPTWYESLMDYVSPGATQALLDALYRKEYGEPWPTLGPEYDVEHELGSRDTLVNGEWVEVTDCPDTPDVPPALLTKAARMRRIRAKWAGLFACPKTPEDVLGYGYNYAAPFGNASCYGKPRPGNPAGGLVRKFSWRVKDCPTTGRPDHPVRYADGKDWRIPLLWYGRTADARVLTAPSRQILICETGFVENAYEEETDNVAAMATPRHPSEWEEKLTDDGYGYVRFPLSGATMQGANYKLRPYRPMPRHSGRVACLMFDGSVEDLPILDIVGVQWGDPDCWYDNIPKTKPPVSPIRSVHAVSDD